MRILFVTEKLPLALDSGARVRAYHLLREAARRHRVTLVTQGRREDAARLCAQVGLERCVLAGEGRVVGMLGRAWGALRTLGDAEPYLRVWAHERARMRREVGRLCTERAFDLVHFDGLGAAVYRDALGATPYVLDEHDAEARRMLRAAGHAGSPWARTYLELQAARLARFEADAVASAAVTTAPSEQEAMVLRALAPEAASRTRVVPDGVDVRARAGRARRPVPGRMVFVGAMDGFANVEGAQWFAREVLPRVRASVPAARLTLVGRSPAAEVRALARGPGVEVTGPVADVAEHYAGAQVCVIPRRVGGAARLAVLESFAAGTPVVSTRAGAEGISARDGVHLLLADGAAAFASAAVRLLSDDGLAARLASAAGALAREGFDWSRAGESLDEAYGAVFAGPARHGRSGRGNLGLPWRGRGSRECVPTGARGE